MDERLREQVAWACRVLAAHGFEDLTLGHVSARATDGRSLHIKRKGVALGEVTPADVLTATIDDVFADGRQPMHLEAVLHTEVYRRRPDVDCVIHAHPMRATALGATAAELEFLTHDAILFKDGLARYDGSPDLVIDAEQGAAVAEALGDRSVLVLPNHGVLIAERDVRWATLAGLTLERALQIQSLARGLGTLRPIAPDLLDEIHASKYQDRFVDEYWDAWIRELRRSGGAIGMPGAEAV